MRILYVSRQFNRSGHAVLQHLMAAPDIEIAAVVVPPLGRDQAHMRWLNRPVTATLERLRHRLALQWYRGQHLRFEESIIRLARGGGLPVLRLPTLKGPQARSTVADLGVDLAVLGGGWPELIPAELLALPPLGAVNTHPSLLPAFRGTDVHRWQVLAGVAATGTTIHYMDERFDTGGILGRASVALDGTETPQELFAATAAVAGPLMQDVLARIAASAPDRAPDQPQQGRDDAGRYQAAWPWDDPSFLTIDWRAPAARIERIVRACAQESYRYLGPTLDLGGDRYVLRRAGLATTHQSLEPGQIVQGPDGAALAGTGTTGTAVRLEVVQPYAPVPNRHRARPGSWLLGRHPGARIALDHTTQEAPDGG